MIDGTMLTEKTKEELIKIILDQDARIRELEEKFKTEQKNARRSLQKVIRSRSVKDGLDRS